MIIKSIRVKDFKGIESAKIDLGRGLNVLHGANETGKSSLVAALRAAFLLPHNSSQAQEYVTWGTDRIPKVELTFETQGTTYRISKMFSRGTFGGATLHRMKGNEAFEEALGRSVDGTLRRLLAWGIPEPGGHRTRRGFPESYLTNALLGRQDDVTSILTANIDEDPSETGKTLLTQALGAMGQAPLVAHLIETLEERTSKVFTPTGLPSKAQDSPMVIKTREIDGYVRGVELLQKECYESEEVEERIELLRAEVAKAEKETSRLQSLVDSAHEAFSIDQKISGLKTQKLQIDSQREQLKAWQAKAETAERELRDLKTKHDELESQLNKARTRLATANQQKTNLEHSVERSKQERRETLTARLHAAAAAMEKAQAVLRAEQDVAERAMEVAAVKQVISDAECALQRAEIQLRYSHLLAQQQAHRVLQERESEAQRQLAKAKEAVRKLEADLQQAQDRLKLAERAVRVKEDLDRVAVNAQRIVTKRDEIRALEGELKQREEQRRNAQSQSRTLEQQLSQARNRKAQLEGERDSHRESADSLKLSRRQSLLANKSHLDQQIVQARAVVDAQEAVVRCEQQFEQDKDKLAVAHESLQHAKKISEYAEMIQVRRRMELANQALTKAIQELAEARESVIQFEADVTRIELQFADAKACVLELKESAKGAERLKSRINALRAEQLQAAEQMQKVTARIGQLQEIGKLGKEHNEKKRELIAVNAKHSNVTEQFAESRLTLEQHVRTTERLRLISYAATLLAVGSAVAAINPEWRFMLIGVAILLLPIAFYLWRLRRSRQKTRQLKELVASSEHEHEELTSHCASLQCAIKRIADDYHSKRVGISGDLKSLYRSAGRERDAIAKALSRIDGEITTCNTKIASLHEVSQDQVDAAEGEVQQRYEQLLQMQSDLRQAKERCQNAESKREALNGNAAKELASIHEQLSIIRSELTEEEAGIDVEAAAQLVIQKQRDYENAGMALRSVEHDRDDAQRRLVLLSDKLPLPAEQILSHAAAKQDEIQQSLDRVDADYQAALGQRIQAVEEAALLVAELQKKYEEASAAVQQADEKCGEHRAKYDRAHGELAQLTQHIPEAAVASAQQSFDESLAILKDKDPTLEIDCEQLSQLAQVYSSQVQAIRAELTAAQDKTSEAKAHLYTVVSEDGQSHPERVEQQITELASVNTALRACDVGEANALIQRAQDDLHSARTNHEVSIKRHADAEARWNSLKESLAAPANEVMQKSVAEREQITADLEKLPDVLNQELHQALAAIDREQTGIASLEQQVSAARKTLDAAAESRDAIQAQVSEARGTLNEVEKGLNADAMSRLETEHHEAMSRLADVSNGGAPLELLLKRLQGDLESARRFAKSKHSEFERATGQLKLIGGAVGEQLADAQETLRRLKSHAEDFEFECQAEKLLLETLTEESESHASHLGNVLAEPVWSLLQDLTGHRYSGLRIEPNLGIEKVTAAGDLRDAELLSVGTRHQLAVLIRLALAAHLKSAVLLDDQLVHSDAVRLAWFREHLRASVAQHQHQVIVVTCRPLDYVDEAVLETPSPVDRDVVKVVDLAKVIVRTAG